MSENLQILTRLSATENFVGFLFIYFRDQTEDVFMSAETLNWFLLVSKVRQSKVHPCTGTEALYQLYGPQGGKGIALLFHDHSTKRW
jgi:hypothetical protein